MNISVQAAITNAKPAALVAVLRRLNRKIDDEVFVFGITRAVT